MTRKKNKRKTTKRTEEKHIHEDKTLDKKEKQPKKKKKHPRRDEKNAKKRGKNG